MVIYRNALKKVLLRDKYKAIGEFFVSLSNKIELPK